MLGSLEHVLVEQIENNQRDYNRNPSEFVDGMSSEFNRPLLGR